MHPKFKKSNDQLIYGYHSIVEALDSGKTFEKIFIQKGIASDRTKEISSKARELSIPVSRAPIEKLDRITRKNHQGFIGFTSPVDYQELSSLIPMIYEKGEDPYLLILDEVTDVRNFGAIARTADAMGIHGIIIPLKRSANINEDAIQTSAGVLNYLPVCRVHSLKETVSFLKESGVKIVACTEKAEMKMNDLQLEKPLCIVMGAEDKGIHPNLLEAADHAVRINMVGKVSSLNVSVAAGLIMHHFSQ
ncbi:MAG: 23S rRNA (guanosine(2251)-2'-O)-methyltransferase RlmB [Flavobacteriales bacterium]|nr:23S rRNA (guanosine(2251)-2'-O)-methyltransferase RlmB [Flavobacteriales bacterium]